MIKLNQQNQIKIWAIITLCLTTVSAISYLIERLALHDILKNIEADLVIKWEMVTYLFILHIFFYISVFTTLVLVIKNLKNRIQQD